MICLNGNVVYVSEFVEWMYKYRIMDKIWIFLKE